MTYRLLTTLFIEPFLVAAHGVRLLSDHIARLVDQLVEESEKPKRKNEEVQDWTIGDDGELVEPDPDMTETSYGTVRQ